MSQAVDAHADAESVPERRSDPILGVTDLDLELGRGDRRRTVLEGINFEVGAGEIVGIIGPSGTGKTSLLRVLAGLEPATRGSVVFEGEPMTGPSRHAVTVFQDYASALLPWRTVERN